MKKIYKELSKKYLKKIENKEWNAISEKTSKKHIEKMLKELPNLNMSIDKSSRFLGFIQGVLCAYGIIDVDQERNETRKLFQKYYKENQITQETIDI